MHTNFHSLGSIFLSSVTFHLFLRTLALGGTSTTTTNGITAGPVLILTLLVLVLVLVLVLARSLSSCALLSLRRSLLRYGGLLSRLSTRSNSRTPNGARLSLRLFLSTLDDDPVSAIGLDATASALVGQQTSNDCPSCGIHLGEFDKRARLVTDDFNLGDFRGRDAG